MDVPRARAYRYLVYWAMLDIRLICQDFDHTWNPFCWSRYARRIRCAGAIADWLHNLALFSSLNFRQFSEDVFWKDFELLRSRYPEFGLERYRDLFDKRLLAPLEGADADEQGVSGGGWLDPDFS